MVKKNCDGFTLVEMLVVIMIISLLAAALFPAMNSIRESGHASQCRAHLKNLAAAAVNYTQGGWGWGDDAQGHYPVAQSYAHYEEKYGVCRWVERRGWVSWLGEDGNNDGGDWGKSALVPNEPPPPPKRSHATCFVGPGVQDGRRAIELGVLWEGTGKNYASYLCPKHKKTRVDGKYPVCRSYAMNGAFRYSVWGDDGRDSQGKGLRNDGVVKIGNIQVGVAPAQATRLLLFAEMQIDPKDAKYDGKKQYGDAVLTPWGDSNLPWVQDWGSSKLGDRENFVGGYNRSFNAFQSVLKSATLNVTPEESVGFNHRMSGKKWGFVAFADGSVGAIPSNMDGSNKLIPGATNLTLRACLGRY